MQSLVSIADYFKSSAEFHSSKKPSYYIFPNLFKKLGNPLQYCLFLIDIDRLMIGIFAAWTNSANNVHVNMIIYTCVVNF